MALRCQQARPAQFVGLLNKEIAAATQSPEILQRFTDEAVLAYGSTPEEFSAYIKKEHVRIGKVIKESGARFE